MWHVRAISTRPAFAAKHDQIAVVDKSARLAFADSQILEVSSADSFGTGAGLSGAF